MIAFTICSNNYLTKAQVLAASLRKDMQAGDEVYLVLADSKEVSIDYNSLGFDVVLLPERLPINNLLWMKEHYSVVEFNTALKSFAFQYIFENTEHKSVYYFDPDIKVYQPLLSFESYWMHSNIVLTPHVLTPMPFDGKFPDESLFLNHGIYNLGFIGLRKSSTTSKFLQWWSERLQEHCIIDLREGYFVDQIWLNLVPVYFPNDVCICKHPGWNMAYWNLHERLLSLKDDGYSVNDERLFFYHFSSFDKELIYIQGKHERPRFDFEARPDMKPLYQDYKNNLVSHNPERYKSIQYFEGQYPLPVPQPNLSRRIVNRIKKEFLK